MQNTKQTLSQQEVVAPEHILAAAEEEFLSVGFAAASIESIAKRARSGKQTIYSYFGTKEKLFLAVVMRLEAKRPGVMAHLSSKRTCWDNLCNYADSIIKTSNKRAYVNAFRLQASVVDSLPEFGSTMLSLYAEWSDELTRYLLSESEAGVLSVNDPEVAMHQLGILAVEGNRLGFGYPFRAPEQRTAIVHRAVRLFMFGHRASPGGDIAPDRPLSLDDPITWEEIEGPSGPVRIFISQERLDELLDIAAQEFFGFGFRRGSVNRIAEIAKLTKTTIYRHFGNKEQLFSAAILHVLRKLHKPAAKSLAPKEPLALLHDIAREFLDTMLLPDNRKLYRTMIIESAEFPELARMVYNIAFTSILDVATSVLVQLQTNTGLFIPYPEWSARQLLFLAICGNRFIITNEEPTSAQREKIVENAVHVFLNGYARDWVHFDTDSLKT